MNINLDISVKYGLKNLRSCPLGQSAPILLSALTDFHQGDGLPWKSILESLLKRCGFKRSGVHILRNTFGAHLAQKGADMAVIRDVSSAPVIDLQRLLDAAIFNYLIGNHDAHGKNFSLLYGAGQDNVRFASLYDLVCTLYYPELSRKMAMKLGGEYLPDKIAPINFEKLAEETGPAKPLVKRRVPALAGKVLEALPTIGLSRAHTEKVAAIIKQRCERTITDFSK